MKKIVFISLIMIFTIVGCKKDDPITYGETLPFENDNIKMELVSSTAPDFIRDIHFFDVSKGIAVTYDGKIYMTIDEGVTWTLQYTNPTPDQPLFQVIFKDADIGYVVGGAKKCRVHRCIPPGGLILKTNDGGNSWSKVFEMNGVEFVSISFNSTGDLFAISNGTMGRISKSTNNGIDWTTIDSTNFHLHRIVFYNNFGFCTGTDGKIIRSSDNGDTWILATTLNANYVTDIKFNSGIGFCIANNFTVFKTNDDGSNWTQKFSSDFGSYVLNVLTSNSCLVFGSGWYTGGDFGNWTGAISQTTNSGDDWTETVLTDISRIRYTSFYTATNGYAVAEMKLIKVEVK